MVRGIGFRLHLWVTSATWLLTGCATFHVYQVGGAGDRELGNQPSTEWQTRTVHSFAWGLLRQDIAIDNCKLGGGARTGIEEVRVKHDPVDIAAALVTLGAWMPITIAWRCAKPAPSSGTLGG